MYAYLHCSQGLAEALMISSVVCASVTAYGCACGRWRCTLPHVLGEAY